MKLQPLSVAALSFTLLWGAAFCQGSVEERARLIADELQLKAGSVVADVGAGDGEWSVEMARRVGSEGHVYATEIDQDVLAKLGKTVKRAKLDNVTTILGDQQHTGLAEECCDAILLRFVYHHFTQPEAMQADLLRSLKPGGLLAVVDFSPDNDLSRSNVPGFREGHGVGPASVEEEMRRAGFELVGRRDRWDDRKGRFLLLFRKPAPFGF